MYVLSDTAHVYRRYLMQLLRNPAWVAIGIIQPVMYLALFGPLLKSVSTVQGYPGGPYNFFVPGLLVQLGLFGATGVGFGLISELRQGVIERMRVTPITRNSLLLGRGLRDVTLLVSQSTLLTVAAIPVGIHLSVAGVLATLALIALLGLMIKDGRLELDYEDEVIAGACITRGGEIVNEAAKQAAGASQEA